MKAWTDLNAVPKPAYIAALPVDSRGYPVQYTAATLANGQPDFRVVDEEKWAKGFERKRCGICGQKISGLFYFVGGPKSIKSRMFFDLHMHQSCAEYALQVCPFLAAPKFSYSNKTDYDLADGKVSETVHSVLPDRPAYFGLGGTAGYRLRQNGNDILIFTDPFISVHWWKDGKRLDAEPT